MRRRRVRREELRVDDETKAAGRRSRRCVRKEKGCDVQTGAFKALKMSSFHLKYVPQVLFFFFF